MRAVRGTGHASLRETSNSMPRPIRTTTPVFAGDDASQREASTLLGGMTVYTDDRLQPGFVRVGIDDPQYFAIHESGVIPVSREMAYGEVVPDPWWFTTPAEVEPYERRDQARHNDGRGGRVRMEYVDEAAHGHDLDLFAEVVATEDRTDHPLLRGLNWWDTPILAEVRSDPPPSADHRHEWAVTAMHMDGGVRFDLGCAHCDAVHRNVHRDRMEQLIDSNTATELDPTPRPSAIPPSEAIIGGHRFPTERWAEGDSTRTLLRVEGFRQNGERIASQRTLQISDQAGRNPEHVEAYRQRIIAQLMEECERAGMLQDDRVRISERPY